MDPVSQGVLGSVLPQAVAPSNPKRFAVAGAGWLAGMLPDADVLIRSSADPLLFLEYHRQFTHSLVFIPMGGLIAAALLWPIWRRWMGFVPLYLVCVLGYGTHGLLDACTSYGTQLLWPFSDVRYAWNNVSIVDPLFTLPLLFLVGWAGWSQRRRIAVIGLCWALGYLSLGVVQRERARSAAAELAARRGHVPVRLSAKPSFGNLLLWKSIYEFDGRFYVDAIRLGGDAQLYEGDSIARFDDERMLELPAGAALLRRDVARFMWFSDRYVAAFPRANPFLGDIRYSFLPHEVEPLWGIEWLDENADGHVRFINRRENVKAKIEVFRKMLWGENIRRFPSVPAQP